MLQQNLVALQSTLQVLTRGATQRSKIQTRAMVNKETLKKQPPQTQQPAKNMVTDPTTCKKATITLTEAKRKAREKNHSAKTTHNEILVKDIYQNVMNCGR